MILYHNREMIAAKSANELDNSTNQAADKAVKIFGSGLGNEPRREQ